jgi:hypothetical protein
VSPFAWADGELVKAKVTQCALSRVCGGCGQSLGRPIAFVGTADEVGRNAFHAPPLHADCAEDVRRALDPSWEVVLTGGFEFVRPAKGDPDPRPTFQPNSLL